eukprot:TRINITY_DN1598_c0_g1::TRINITY_DN1598_c0_g1_i1::g.28193::m.28193 TRINITY_DN1598_c0_g1::TRINITY_DN1598_c0_g1_i1::g.28193  ORF type:complete len:265 (+),score=27.07,sp/P76093/YNBD_ECOLI/28.41/5e-09,DSPc/PF00782.15/5.2e-12,Y_phosphatase/PF00102.22/0.0023,PTPlike_phytase/PF14566.1/0.019,CDKN3/PF05706.7/0.095 TRINITY_DN1598_c0_g1_i1:88-882(+)
MAQSPKPYTRNPHQKLNALLVMGGIIFTFLFYNFHIGYYIGVWSTASYLVAQAVHFQFLDSRIFGKRADGTQSLLLQILLFPYFVMLWSIMHTMWRSPVVAAYDEIVPGLFIGRRPQNFSQLPEGTHLVVDLTSEIAAAHDIRTHKQLTYRCIPVRDFGIPSTKFRPPFRLAAIEAARRLQLGERVYIHCYLGRGRSAMFVAAVLYLSGNAPTIDEAMNMIRKKRPCVHFMHETVEHLRELALGLSPLDLPKTAKPSRSDAASQ